MFHLAELRPVETRVSRARPLVVQSSSAEARSQRSLRVEAVEPGALPKYREAWTQLAANSREPNVFLHPAFALPLLERAPHSFRCLLVWGEGADDDELVGLWPIKAGRFGAVRGYSDKLVSVGIPLLHRQHATASFEAMLEWLACHSPLAAMVIATHVPLEGIFGRELLAKPGARHRALLLESHERALLDRGGHADEQLSRKARKDHARLRRRLGDVGRISYRSACDADDVGKALDEFLSLEHSGWKGRRGTSLLAAQRDTIFVKTMISALAKIGSCRVDALYCDERMIAAGLILRAGPQAYFWKTAFAEDFAKYSPGVLFTLDLAEVQRADASVASTDSCAIADHPMIDRLWPDRLEIGDVCIALPRRSRLHVAAACLCEQSRRRLRAWAKIARARLRGSHR